MKGNPFGSRVAVENSNLYFIERGQLTAFEPAVATRKSFVINAHQKFRELVMRPEFSCLGAKAALIAGTYGFAVYDKMGGNETTAGLSRDLCHFVQSGTNRQRGYSTFVAVFHSPAHCTEAEFEAHLWQQLRMLHQADKQHFDWDKNASPDPHDPLFSFSFAGRALYVVGMHPKSSRQARRFPWPTLVFNPHEQFERLRADGKWKRMQGAIRRRELVLQGNINPMLSDFGEESEARQYSGRIVPKNWRAPFPNANGGCPFGH